MFLFNCYEKKARKIACEVSERECLHTSRVEMGDGVVRWLSKIMGTIWTKAPNFFRDTSDHKDQISAWPQKPQKPQHS